jgi:SAM-dependent methyltransferase
VVIDLAAGTGKLTRRLLESGARVVAIEPLPEMRALLARTAPGAEPLDGTAERMPLAEASADAVTVGQAFHWFRAEPALAEIARVLAPAGALALVWNIRDLDDPLQAELNGLLAPYRRQAPSEHEQPWRAALAASPFFGPFELRSFAWDASSTAPELRERIASVSFVAALSPAEREALLDRVEQLARTRGEPFPFRYRTDVYVVERLAPPG